MDIKLEAKVSQEDIEEWLDSYVTDGDGSLRIKSMEPIKNKSGEMIGIDVEFDII